MSDKPKIPELDASHPLHEDFDFIAFARKNEATLINLKNDAKLLATKGFSEVATLVCAAVTSDKTTILAPDLPLPVPTEEPYAGRFVSFVERMERYFHCLHLEQLGYMKRNDSGFEPTERGKKLVNKGSFGDGDSEDC